MSFYHQTWMNRFILGEFKTPTVTPKVNSKDARPVLYLFIRDLKLKTVFLHVRLGDERPLTDKNKNKTLNEHQAHCKQ